jgi:hypothetical protein
MTADAHWTQLLQAPKYCCMSHGWLILLELGCPGTCSGCGFPPSSHPSCAQSTPEHRDISACQNHNLNHTIPAAKFFDRIQFSVHNKLEDHTKLME